MIRRFPGFRFYRWLCWKPGKILWMVSASIIGLSCSPADEPVTGRCYPQVRQAIVHGTVTPEIALGADRQAAIGALETPGGGVICSASLVAERWVLTARHCAVPDAFDALVFHTSGPQGDAEVLASSYQRHPELDAMLVELPPSTALARAAPYVLDLTNEPVSEAWIGRELTLAGMGATEDGSRGERRFVQEQVVAVDAHSIVVDGKSEQGACTGDSGGPLLAVDPTGTVRIVGILTQGSASCRDLDRYLRVDLLTRWISEVLLAADQDPCRGMTWEGTCDQGYPFWCDGHYLATDVCTGHRLCGWSTKEMGYRCVDETEDPCGGVGPAGDCDGDTFRVCRHGTLWTTDCGECGRKCDWPMTGEASCR